VNNNRKLSTDMAVRLAKAFDTTAKIFLNIQQSDDEWEVTSIPRLQEEIDRVIPAHEIIERKHIVDSSEKKHASA
ncbi:addiction module antidote protein, HigA family, partial (plasmid) [Enterobacter hormaechei]